MLNKSKDEGITMEDLDGLQLELETMLSSVAVRTRTLTSEIAALNVLEEQRDKKGQLALLKIVSNNYFCCPWRCSKRTTDGIQ